MVIAMLTEPAVTRTETLLLSTPAVVATLVAIASLTVGV